MTDLPHPLQDLLGESYTLGRELGRGGMATVYLAHDHKHDRSVALKHAMSLRDDLHTATALRRFEALPHDVFWGALDRVTEGRILAKRGRTEEALNLLDRAFSWDWAGPPFVLTTLERGALAEKLGQKERALTSYQFVADVWRHADPELTPYVDQAREGLARLTSEPRP